jgi:hypothetical protein
MAWEKSPIASSNWPEVKAALPRACGEKGRFRKRGCKRD